MRTFGLIGYPLTHSFSQKYFSEKFARENITDAQYLNFPIEDIFNLKHILLENPDLLGLNITIPHKESVIQLLDQLDEHARAIGAVNTLKIQRQNKGIVLTGYNTDYYGFWKSIQPFLKVYHKSALILGTGGASKAIAYSLENKGVKYKYVSRIPKEQSILSYKDLTKKVIDDHLIIINCSPLGTYPNVDQFPDIPYHYLTSNHLLYDLVYNPLETSFIKKGKEFNATTTNGLKMLHLQAEKAWKIWNSNNL